MSKPDELLVSRFARLVLWQAAQGGANQIELFIEESSTPGRRFRVRFGIDGAFCELSPPSPHIFEPVVAYFLNRASVTPGKDGSLTGTLHVHRQIIIPGSKEDGRMLELPASNWIVWSNNREQKLVLTRDAMNVAGS